MKYTAKYKAGKEFTQENILSFLRKHDVFMFLNSNKAKQVSGDPYSSFDWIAAAGVYRELNESNNNFDALRSFYEQEKDYFFCFLSYDLKNDTENLTSSNFDGIKAPLMHFFSPLHLFTCKDDFIEAESREKDFERIYKDSFLESETKQIDSTAAD